VRRLGHGQLAAAARAGRWFSPERPGPLVGAHLVRTGIGWALADRWPAPRAALVAAGGNLSLAGDPAALDPAALRAAASGFVDVPAPFRALAGAAFPDAARLPRVVAMLTGPPRRVRAALPARRLGAADAGQLAALSPDLGWVAASWGGPAGLAASGRAFGAFDGGRLVAVACPFFAGASFEDVGVVTEPAWRGLGLAGALGAAVCADARARGRVPTWTTSSGNLASRRVAARLGFALVRTDELLAVG
jgi:GNAT superfamily N-acetyltransferase